MNIFQTLFTLLFALYFAVTTTVTGKLHPFDTPSIYKGYRLATARFVYAIVVLNLIPLIYFWWVYTRLEVFKNSTPSLIELLLVLWASLAGQGVYRLFYGSMLLRKRTGKGFIFYDHQLYKDEHEWLPISLYNDMKDRPFTHQAAANHIIPSLIWILSSIVSALLIH